MESVRRCLRSWPFIAEAVDDHLDVVLLLLLRAWADRSSRCAATPSTLELGCIPRRVQLLEEIDELTLARRARPGRGPWNRMPSSMLEHLVDDLLRPSGLAIALTADGAVRGA